MNVQTSHPRRDRAIAALEQRGETIQHATGPATIGHGHPGLCCCLMGACRSDACTVNAEIVRQLRPLGLRARDLREHLGLDYRSAAALIGIGTGALHRLENDPTLDPRTSTVEAVEAWLASHPAPPLAEDRIPEPYPMGSHRIIEVPTLSGDMRVVPGAPVTPATREDELLDPSELLDRLQAISPGAAVARMLKGHDGMDPAAGSCRGCGVTYAHRPATWTEASIGLNRHQWAEILRAAGVDL